MQNDDKCGNGINVISKNEEVCLIDDEYKRVTIERNVRVAPSSKRRKYKCSMCGKIKSNHICSKTIVMDASVQATEIVVRLRDGVRIMNVNCRY